jgi:hypothetical protein
MSYTFDTIQVPRAKALAIAAIAALSCGVFAATPARADDAGSQICLQTFQIDHTEILNKNQILFYMNGKKIWVNTLPSPCSMDNTDGFVWRSSIPQYCDNLETIKIIRTGQVCRLGKFTPYEKTAKPS